MLTRIVANLVFIPLFALFMILMLVLGGPAYLLRVMLKPCDRTLQ